LANVETATLRRVDVIWSIRQNQVSLPLGVRREVLLLELPALLLREGA
jgi:hypothetical protein